MRTRRTMTKTALALALILVVGWIGPARAQVDSEPDSGENPDALRQEFTLGVGDVVRVSVWKNEELEAEVPVRPDGRISLLLIGDIDVVGQTTESVRQALTARYAEFVNAPGVSVMVTEINSRKIYILGEVAEPGAYDLIQPTRLLQALAMAGGLTEFAKKDNAVLLRDIAGQRQRYLLNLKMITGGTQLSNDVMLSPGDTIFVP